MIDQTSRPRIVVTGTQGQVVRALLERAPVHNVEVLALGRPALDLRDEASIAGALGSVSADVIINAAAMTGVDQAEAEPELARRINGDGAGHVASAAARLGIPVVQLSTDYVFDGASTRPYLEIDITNPVNGYGRSKHAGELAVALANPDHVILRAAWIYSPYGQNFFKTILRLGARQESVDVVCDQYGYPTSALDLADAIIAVCSRLYAEPANASLRGIFHVSGTGSASWAEIAAFIFLDAARLGCQTGRVRPIAGSDYPSPAKRPANSLLNSAKLKHIYSIALPQWQSSAHDCISRLVTETKHEIAGLADREMS